MSEPKIEPEATPVLYAEGATCATLTPRVRARLRELEEGSELVVFTDDPSARVDMPAWSRLTGNELVATVELDAVRTRFHLRKK
jgi:TusA-related sulfurtransferase